MLACGVLAAAGCSVEPAVDFAVETEPAVDETEPTDGETEPVDPDDDEEQQDQQRDDRDERREDQRRNEQQRNQQRNEQRRPVAFGMPGFPEGSITQGTIEGRLIEACGTGELCVELVIIDEESFTVREGQVIRTDPPANAPVRPGDTVTVVRSAGPGPPDNGTNGNGEGETGATNAGGDTNTNANTGDTETTGDAEGTGGAEGGGGAEGSGDGNGGNGS